jgi:ankyrin repeat protein
MPRDAKTRRIIKCLKNYDIESLDKKLINTKQTNSMSLLYVIKNYVENHEKKYRQINGLIDTCKLLIKHKADVNFCKSSNTPLTMISRCTQDIRNSNLIMKLLLDNKADVTSYSNHAIDCAIKAENYENVKLLLEYGADIHSCGKPKLSLWRNIHYSPINFEMTKLLVENGICIDGNTILTKELNLFLAEHKNKLINIIIKWMPKVLCKLTIDYVYT